MLFKNNTAYTIINAILFENRGQKLFDFIAGRNRRLKTRLQAFITAVHKQSFAFGILASQNVINLLMIETKEITYCIQLANIEFSTANHNGSKNSGHALGDILIHLHNFNTRIYRGQIGLTNMQNLDGFIDVTDIFNLDMIQKTIEPTIILANSISPRRYFSTICFFSLNTSAEFFSISYR